MNIEKNKLIIGIVVVVVLIVGGVVAFHLMQPKEPTIEEANVILDESIKNTFNLTSFTTKGDAEFQIKSGEIVLVEVAMKNMQTSMTGLWDFANLDSSMVVTYDIMMNLVAIADLIETNVSPEELDPDMFMGMDPIAMLKAIGEANITATMEIKSIDSDSYMRITGVAGLREVITSVAGPFMADMAMKEIEANIGIWYKTPADPKMIEEMKPMYENIDSLMNVAEKSSPNILFVKEVLPNTRVNDVAVYNFTTDIDLNKTRDFVISLISLIDEMMKEEMMEEYNAVEEYDVAEIKQKIEENWPKVVKAIEAIEIESRTYICQERRVVMKEVGRVNMDFYRIITALEPMMVKDMTVEELEEFNKQKETIRNTDIGFVVTGNFIYSDHNVVPAITAPTEYQLIE